MYKTLLIALIIVVFTLVGCTTPTGSSSTDSGKNYVIKVIDGCEYIECDYGIFDQRVYSLTHKGNCKNRSEH